MKQFNLTNILIVIILGLLVYLALKPDGNSQYLDMIQQQKKEIIKLMQENQKQIEQGFKDIKLIEKKETIIRNYYNEIIKGIDSLSDFNAIDNGIRQKLDTLGSARFE